MAYKSLYRTYRPQTFKDVAGQEAIITTLCRRPCTGFQPLKTPLCELPSFLITSTHIIEPLAYSFVTFR